MDASEHHNRLAHEFVQSVGRGTRRPSEIAVVLETVILASMRLMTMHGQQPRVSSAMAEAALQRALERFTENPGREFNSHG